MKYLSFFIPVLIACNTYAKVDSPCDLENYFRKTETYKSGMLDNEEKLVELERERLTLLPNISVTIGQQSTNDSSFKGISDSSVSLSLSQSVYNGGRYSKFKNKIKKDIEYNGLMIHDKRNRYLIDLYRSVIEYKYKIDLHQLYSSQLKLQEKQLEATKARLASGDIAKIEYDIVGLRKEELQNEVDIIKNEIEQTELDISIRFNIPVTMIKEITGKKILSCKGKGSGQILNESRELLKQNENANYQLNMTSMQPSVSMSLHMRPPSGGTLNELTTKKTEFAAGISVSVPLSAYFSANNYKKDYSISVSRIDDSYDEKQKLYIREKDNIINKIKNLESNIDLTKEKIELKRKEVEYILSRFRDKKDTIISYYRQLDEFELEKIKLKKDEREREYFKAYIAILD
ncbi:TolC family protein [Escherichia coli]|uniref:TolC family protein n=1 Tax=Escherichia coli TaxID=562 RepID=UPI000E2CA6DD|nr:TolC family protein [Escherichia coli]EEZ5662149.1 TolC family protein [Escherichia coli O5]RDP83848.1 Outer membrane efflux protein [Escherichia coli]